MKGARNSSFKRKRSREREALDLEGKVAAAGGDGCFGLEAVSRDDDDDQRTGNSGTSLSVDGGSNIRQFRRFRAIGDPSHGGSHGQRANDTSATGSIRNPYAMRRARRSRSSTGATNTTRSDASLVRAAIHIVCAVGENLARETCIASLNAGSPVTLQITKQANGQTYAETLAYLEMLNPDEVLLNEGRQNSQLASKVLQLFGGIQSVDGVRMMPRVDHYERDSGLGECKTSTVVKFISRSCFDQTRGADLLRRVTRDDSYDTSLIEDYTVVSSAHAVLHYTQQCLGASISRKCLQVIFDSGGKNQMTIDRSTLLQLELLANAKTGKTRGSLMATIDCTKTTVGSRLLRTNLMAPPCRADTINARLDLVDALLADEDFFYLMLHHLKSLPDVDKMLATVAVVPQARRLKVDDPGDKPNVSVRMASKGISALVCIKTTLTLIPAFATDLSEQLGTLEPNDDLSDNASGFRPTPEDSSLLVGLGKGPSSSTALQRKHLMSAIIKAMKNPALGEVLEAVSDIFMESTNFSRSPNAMRHQECFALKSADDGLLDVLRKAFLSNVDDIYKKADEYAETYKIHVNVKYAASRGYYLSLPGETATTLPQIFIQPAKRASSINCTTEEVQSLNSRAQDNVNDLLLMTTERIKAVLDFARSNYDALASLSDAVALLDLCHSFADNVTLSKLPWCRPVITDGPDSLGESNRNTIVIRQGRYGIDVVDAWQTSDGPGAFVPNDTYASEQKSFTLLSGANGSGKSTYLKQIGIIVVLAHCGSYVPAQQASIPVSVLSWNGLFSKLNRNALKYFAFDHT
jgi:DNA mismatch repair protein MSH4